LIVHELRHNVKYPKRLTPIKEYKMSPSLSYIFGVMKGDGCAYISNSWFLRLDVKDEDFAREFIKHISNVEPNCSPCIYQTNRGNWIGAVANKSLYHAYINFDSSIMEKASEEEKIMFIKGFYDSEGCSYANFPRAIYCSNTNSEFLLLIQQLLESINIASSLHKLKQKNPKHKICYHLMIHARWNILLFNEKVGFTIKRKQDKLTNMCNNYNKTIPYTSEQYYKVLELSKQNVPKSMIVKTTGIGITTVRDWINKKAVPCSVKSKSYVGNNV
jgi:intein-encoded DNA endonuclease-like protein